MKSLGFNWHALGCFLGFTCAATAQDSEPLKLNYRELTERQSLTFQLDGIEHKTPVGRLNWEFPSETFATVGLEPKLTTFCLEPLLPVVAGQSYSFRLEPFGTPQDFQLKNDDAGRAEAKRRTKLVRELYGRTYPDILKDPTVAAPAFQIALWEILNEKSVPDANPVLDLDAGRFATNFPKEDANPESVARAVTHLKSLTGDDAVFATTPDLAGQELVRLTGLRNSEGILAQSQIALRNLGGSSAGGGGAGDAGGPLGTGPIFGGGGLGRASPLGGLGGIGGGLGGIGGGFGGTTTNGFATTGTTATTDINSPGPTSPQTTVSTPGTDSNNPSNTNPVIPDNPTPNPNPVPAPPGLVLAGVAFGVLSLSRAIRRRR